MVMLIWLFVRALCCSIHFCDAILKLLCNIVSSGFFEFICLPVLTGIVAALFTDGLRKFRHRKHIEDCKVRLHKAFHPVRCPHTKLQVVPRYKPLATLQANLSLDEKDIIEAVEASVDMHLRNLASTYSVSDNQKDKLVVECFPCEGRQRKYGYIINQGRDVTIISPSSLREVGTSHFAYLLAKFGGFNYISREYSPATEEHDSFYNSVEQLLSSSSSLCTQFKEFESDIKTLCYKSNHWAIYVLGTTRESNNQIHIIHSCKSENGFESLICEEKKHVVSEIDDMWKTIKNPDFEVKSNTSTFWSRKNDLPAHAGGGTNHNALVIRVAYELSARDNHHIAIAKCIAKYLNEYIVN